MSSQDTFSYYLQNVQPRCSHVLNGQEPCSQWGAVHIQAFPLLCNLCLTFPKAVLQKLARKQNYQLTGLLCEISIKARSHAAEEGVTDFPLMQKSLDKRPKFSVHKIFILFKTKSFERKRQEYIKFGIFFL